MRSRACPVCGSDSNFRVYAEAQPEPGSTSRQLPEYAHYRLNECRRCDSLYANPLPARQVPRRAYVELADVNPGIPQEPGIVPPLLDRALPLHQVIPVDYHLPGCPPPADRIRALLTGLLAGSVELPPPMLKFG